jgi:ribosome-associated protein
MDIRKLQRAIVDGLEDVKGQDIVVFNTEHLAPLFERVIVASGTSNRQTKALAASVRKSVRAAGFDVMRTEGEDNGEWIIVDCAAAVVHLMQPAIRQYYLLEEIWGEKPVKLKLNDVVTRLVKASEPMNEDDDEEDTKPKRATGKKSVAGKLDAPVRKVAAKKVVAKKAVAKTPAERSTSTRAPAADKKVAAKKAAAKKVASKKVAATPVVPKTLVVNRPVVKKVAGKKVAVKKVAAKKVAAKPAPARKVAAKKVARKAS